MAGQGEERQLAVALLSRAEAERRRLLQEAKAEARKIMTEAEAEVRALRDARLAEARRRAELALARRRSETRHRSVEEEARLVERAAERVLEKAAGALGQVRTTESYGDLLARLVEECLSEFPDSAPIRLVVDSRDVERLEGKLTQPGRLRVEPGGPFLGGVMASDGAKTLVVDNTFEARVRARTSEIRRLLGEVFLGDGPPEETRR